MSAGCFDGNFGKLLAKTLAAGVSQLEDCQPLVRSENLRLFIRKHNRKTFNWLCYVHRIEPISRRPKTRKAPFQTSAARVWPRVLVMVFLACVAWLLFNLYHQYTHDANLIRLTKLRLQPKHSDLNASSSEALAQQLETKIRTARNWLKATGAAHVQWTLLIQCLFICLLEPTVMLFVILPEIYHYSRSFFISMQTFLNPNFEQRVRISLILLELRRLEANSCSLGTSKLEQIEHELSMSLGNHYNNWMRDLREAIRFRAKKHIARRHRLTVQLLREIALAGRLNPPNKSPACQDLLALSWFLLTWLIPILFVLGIGLIYFGLRRLTAELGVQVELASFRDELELVVSWVFLPAILGLSTTHSGILFISILIDQWTSARCLERLISKAVYANKRRLMQLATLSQMAHLNGGPTPNIVSAISRVGLDLESDLLIVLGQLRLFMRAFEGAARTLSHFSGLILSSLLVSVVSIRLHSAYYKQELKNVCVLASLGSTALGFSILLPIGIIHKRCMSMREKLWMLAAQVSQSESDQMVSSVLMTDLNLAMLTLRRELADSNLQARRFECHVFRMPVTYENLIKAAFWTLLIVMADGIGTNRFMNDPFGLYWTPVR